MGSDPFVVRKSERSRYIEDRRWHWIFDALMDARDCVPAYADGVTRIRFSW